VVIEHVQNFATDFVNRPQFYLSCLSLTMHQVNNITSLLVLFIILSLLLKFILNKTNELIEQFKKQRLDKIDNSDIYNRLPSIKRPIPIVKARVLNFSPVTKIKQLKAEMYDKFVSIVGTVVRVSNSKPFVTRLAFMCNKCSSTFVIKNFYLNTLYL